jgi:ADP-ribose diphosphatase
MSRLPKITGYESLVDTGIFRVQAMNLVFNNGQQRRYQRILGTPQGAVLVVPQPDPDHVLLIREYAAAMERYELAFPKGHIEVGETALEAANRELQEEVGMAARQVELLRSVTLAPGYLQHTTHMVLARDLYPQSLQGDEPEPIEVVSWPLDALDELLAREDFTEARSQLALLLLARQQAPLE